MKAVQENPGDFIKFVCMKCPNEIDDEPFPKGCICYATRDHAPTLCCCRGDPQWEIEFIVWREGER